MRQFFVFALLIILCALLLTGCPKPATQGPAPVRILAYVNVTSGCQQATVDFLKKLQTQYGSRLQLEFVDFGDGGVGAQRWQSSGNTCQTLEINGSSTVTFLVAGQPKTVTFQMPVGFKWSFEDLTAAVEAAVAGKLTSGGSRAAASAVAPLQAEVRVTQVANGKTPSARLTVNQVQVLLIKASANGQLPLQRAQGAAAAIKAWLATPVLPSDLSLKRTDQGWGLLAGGRPVVAVTQADAKAAGKSVDDVARAWLSNLKQAVVAAAGACATLPPAGKKAAAKKTLPEKP